MPSPSGTNAPPERPASHPLNLIIFLPHKRLLTIDPLLYMQQTLSRVPSKEDQTVVFFCLECYVVDGAGSTFGNKISTLS